MTMRWGLAIRRAPSLTRLSRTVLNGRAGNSQRPIEMDRTADPLTVRGDRRECRPIHTDRRGEVCGNRGATVVRPVGREGRAWRDCSSSRGWRSWWRTLAKSGCSTWTRHGCSRHRRSPHSICSTAMIWNARGRVVEGHGLQRRDRLLNVEEAAEKLGVKPDWLYRHHKNLAVHSAARQTTAILRTGD